MTKRGDRPASSAGTGRATPDGRTPGPARTKTRQVQGQPERGTERSRAPRGGGPKAKGAPGPGEGADPARIRRVKDKGTRTTAEAAAGHPTCQQTRGDRDRKPGGRDAPRTTVEGPKEAGAGAKRRQARGKRAEGRKAVNERRSQPTGRRTKSKARGRSGEAARGKPGRSGTEAPHGGGSTQIRGESTRADAAAVRPRHACREARGTGREPRRRPDRNATHTGECSGPQPGAGMGALAAGREAMAGRQHGLDREAQQEREEVRGR